MPDEGLSVAEESAAGTDEAPKPKGTEEAPAADDGGTGTQDPGFDPELGLVPEAGEVEDGESEGTDGFEGYDEALDSDDRPPLVDEEAEGAEDEQAAKEDVDPTAEDAAAEEAAAEEEAEAEEDGTPPETFTFGGEEFDSKEAAEQNFKSLRGQHKNVKATEAENETLKQANASWEAFHKTEMEKAGQKPQGSTDAKPGDAKPEPGQEDAAAEIIAKHVDWKAIEKIHEDEGFLPALQYALYETLTETQKRNNEMVRTETEGFRKTQQQAHVEKLGADLFVQAAGFTDQEGNKLYPEFDDAAQTEQVFNIWNRLDFPDEVMFSPKGIYMAVLAHRDTRGRFTKEGKKASTTPKGGAKDPVVASVEAANKAGSNVASGSGRTVASKKKLASQARAEKAIMDAGSGLDPDLGLTP